MYVYLIRYTLHLSGSGCRSDDAFVGDQVGGEVCQHTFALLWLAIELPEDFAMAHFIGARIDQSDTGV